MIQEIRFYVMALVIEERKPASGNMIIFVNSEKLHLTEKMHYGP